jgi:hypothetical protein
MRLTLARVLVALFPRRAKSAHTRPPARRASARRALALCLTAFVPVLLLAWALAESIAPEITDTDYHFRLRAVRAARAENPTRPLGIVIGSSRTAFAFQPEQVPDADGIYWMNESRFRAGPRLNRLILHRLLRDGVRPAVVVLEVMPPYFVRESDTEIVGCLAVSELSFARRYADDPLKYDYHFLRQRLSRASSLGRVADPFDGYRPAYTPRGGYPALFTELTPPDRARAITLAHKMNAEALRDLTVQPGADRALRDTLGEAAEHGIRAILLLAPEGPTFRSWYDPADLARFDAYIAAVATEYRAPLLDSRCWLEEADFIDSHHVLKRGAEKFTARFARETAAMLSRHAPGAGESR